MPRWICACYDNRPMAPLSGLGKVYLSVSKDRLRVTDKRMFTAEGELRDAYRFLEEAGGEAPSPDGKKVELLPREERLPPEVAPDAFAAPSPGGAEGRFEIPDPAESMGGPSFSDLVAMLAEPAAVFLGDVELPDGSSQEDLAMARLHIDLLDVLRQKTLGNLGAQESALLEDILYQLRMRYVQKRG